MADSTDCSGPCTHGTEVHTRPRVSLLFTVWHVVITCIVDGQHRIYMWQWSLVEAIYLIVLLRCP